MVSAPKNVWFVVAATDGAATDGGYGRDLSGPERTHAGAFLVRPAIAQHLTNNGCP